MANTGVAIIYIATHIDSQRQYVGLTSSPLRTRWSAHNWVAQNNAKTHFHRSLKKYGKEAFSIEQIATCLSLSDAFAVERAVIQDRKPHFNQTNGGEFTVGRRASPESIEKIRQANLGKKRTDEQKMAASQSKLKQFAEFPELREKAVASIKFATSKVDRVKQKLAASLHSKNRIWTHESRKKLSDSCMGRRLPQEAIDRMAKSKNKPVECIDLACTFDSLLDAAKTTGIQIAGISKVCRGERISAGGMRFQFI